MQVPPSDLEGFPNYVVLSGQPLYRIHLAERQAIWFCSDVRHRFDLRPPHGTCHTAEQPIGSFIEVFQDMASIPMEEIQVRSLTELRPARDLNIADCTSRFGRTYG